LFIGRKGPWKVPNNRKKPQGPATTAGALGYKTF
jgi:hypothetical protein